MELHEHKFISVVYDLYTVDDGQHLVERTTEEQPFSFISGFGVAIQPFEDEVINLDKGDTFDFTLTPQQAYGDYEEARRLQLDRELFTEDGHFDHEHVRKGAVIPLENEEGMRFSALVTDITDDKVHVDLNHPLAGKTIRFTGSIAESRPATEEEINHLVRMLAGEGCCGDCGCDSCGDDCHCH